MTTAAKEALKALDQMFNETTATACEEQAYCTIRDYIYSVGITPPASAEVEAAIKTIREWEMTIAEGIGYECWNAVHTLITAATQKGK
jgi:hypothetical protein